MRVPIVLCGRMPIISRSFSRRTVYWICPNGRGLRLCGPRARCKAASVHRRMTAWHLVRRVLMAIGCSLFGHSWRCGHCSRCGTEHPKAYFWGADGKRRVNGHLHSWDGCRCITCGEALLVPDEVSGYGPGNWDGTHVWSKKDCDKCERCGSRYSDFVNHNRYSVDRTKATRHSWGAWRSAGELRRERTCKTCGCTHSESWNIPGG